MDRDTAIMEALGLAISHTARGRYAAAVGVASLALAHLALALSGDDETPVGGRSGGFEQRDGPIHGRPLKDYLSPIPLEGYDTVLGFLAKHDPETLELMDDPEFNPEATARDGWWLTHQFRRRYSGEPPKTSSPPVLRSVGIHEVNMYPVSLLKERFKVEALRRA